MTPLTDLLRRVEGASGPDRDIDVLIAVEIDDMSGEKAAAWARYIAGLADHLPAPAPPQKYTASVDAALALVERVLPDTVRPGFQQNPDRTWQAAILRVEPDDSDCPVASGATAPLAILAALLKALIARSDSSQSSVPARC